MDFLFLQIIFDPMIGKFLLASPELLVDEVFSKAVILITDEHQEGTVGFVINKPLSLRVSEVSDALQGINCQLWEGGPVAPDNLYFMHNLPELFRENIPVKPGVFWSADFERLTNWPQNDPSHLRSYIKFFLGYTGWSPGQLKDEINKGFWLVVDEPDLDIYTVNPATLWKDLVHKHRPQWDLWLNAPTDPGLN